MAIRVSPDRFYRVLHRIADGHVGRMERAFLAAIARQAEQVDRSGLALALARGDVEAAFFAIGLNGQLQERVRQAYVSTLQSAFTQAGVSTASSVARVAGVTARFDLTNPRALLWAARRSSAKVTQITHDTKRIVRRAISRGFRQGITVQGTGRALRPVLVDALPETLGLTLRQYVAVERFRDRLVDEGADDVEGRTARYAAKQLRRRALTIARTETIAASNAGQSELWRQYAERDLIDATSTRRVWIITPDDRLCEICEAIPDLNPEGVGLNKPFLTPDGPVDAPPAHPNCRCAQGLEFVEITTRAAA